MNVIEETIKDIRNKLAVEQENATRHMAAHDEAQQNVTLLQAMLAQVVPAGEAPVILRVEDVYSPAGHSDLQGFAFAADRGREPPKPPTIACAGGCGNARRYGHTTCADPLCLDPRVKGAEKNEVIVKKNVQDASGKALDYMIACDHKGGATLAGIALELYASDNQVNRTRAANAAAILKRDGKATNHVRGLWRASAEAMKAAEKKGLEAKSAFVGKGA